MLRLMNSPNRTGSIETMDKPERKDTAQQALLFVGIAVTVVVVAAVGVPAAE